VFGNDARIGKKKFTEEGKVWVTAKKTGGDPAPQRQGKILCKKSFKRGKRGRAHKDGLIRARKGGNPRKSQRLGKRPFCEARAAGIRGGGHQTWKTDTPREK